MSLSYEFGMADSGLTPLPIDSLLLGYHEEQQAVFRQRECQIWYVLQLFFVISRSGFSVNETKQHCEQPFRSHVRNHLCYKPQQKFVY